jgi:cytochrome c556
MTKEYAKLCGALPKNECPKGNAASWAKLTKQCADDAKSLDLAAGKKDKTAALAAWGKLNKGCQACHDEHR